MNLHYYTPIAIKNCLIKCKLALSFLFMLKVKINFRLWLNLNFPRFPDHELFMY